MTNHKQIPHRAKVHLLEDRLKTLEKRVKLLELIDSAQKIHNKILEDKVKFIMENAESMALPIKEDSLQDLWDETHISDKNTKEVIKEIDKELKEPTVKFEASITNGLLNVCVDDLLKFENNLNNLNVVVYYKDKNGEYVEWKPTVKECNCDDGVTLGCKCKEDKIEEILSEFENIGSVMMSDKALMRMKSWLRDKLKEL